MVSSTSGSAVGSEDAIISFLLSVAVVSAVDSEKVSLTEVATSVGVESASEVPHPDKEMIIQNIKK